MKFYDASGAHPNHPGWPDGLNHIPARWGMGRIRTLYEQDFSLSAEYATPVKDTIRQLAEATLDETHVVIDIEGWRLFLPDTWSWDNWEQMRPEYQAVAPSAAGWNDKMVSNYRFVCREFKKHNSVSRLGWYDVPTTSDLYELYWRDDRGYRDPASSWGYHGYIGTETWAWSQLAEWLDFGCVNGYWSPGIPHWDDYSLSDWGANLQHAKAVAGAALDGPLCVYLMPVQNVPGQRLRFDPAVLDAQLEHLDRILQPDDMVALWSGSASSMSAADAELAEPVENNYWVYAWDRWAS